MSALNFPSNPTDKQLYRATSGRVYQWNHSRKVWSTVLSAAAASTSANPGNTPPLNPNIGTLWLDTDTNILYVRVNNNGVGEWRATAGGSTSTTSGTGLSLEGTATYDGIELTDIGIYLEALPET